MFNIFIGVNDGLKFFLSKQLGLNFIIFWLWQQCVLITWWRMFGVNSSIHTVTRFKQQNLKLFLFWKFYDIFNMIWLYLTTGKVTHHFYSSNCWFIVVFLDKITKFNVDFICVSGNSLYFHRGREGALNDTAMADFGLVGFSLWKIRLLCSCYKLLIIGIKTYNIHSRKKTIAQRWPISRIQ